MPTADAHLARSCRTPFRAAASACVVLMLTLGSSACGIARTGSVLPTGTGKPTATPFSSPTAIEPLASIRLDSGAGLALPGDDGALYVATETAVYRVDPGTDEAVQVVDGLAAPYGFNIGFGSAWISRADEEHGWIERYDLGTGALLAEIEVGRMPLETLTAFGSIWAPNHHSSTLSRIDPESNTVVATIEVHRGAGDPYGLAADDRFVWMASPNSGVSGIDPQTNAVVHEMRASACGVAAVADRVWAAACESPLVIVFPETGGDAVGRLREAGAPFTDGERFWTITSSEHGDSLLVGAFDPETLEVGATVDTGIDHAAARIVAYGSLWITSSDTVYRYSLDTLPT